ncbi:exopolysaccharide biosynthesis polyprenyl glycosylphosphotransferase [Hydrococcus rivularis NIES-593]|uniref:Exopolysaccharide biosynthesis polyprenyl glycosylphosphotransferase n=1 Tax=Hydrococcus rivularis NIES-593 TaxID=1921803 RepID=A0A1U7HFN8_9CYAN|nr:sugar transferase [Hydrococcus rivularis]OKH22397.1 exopolysaccharide biosynthesis polyprenyl glycosylphosphotransferase [Hydrococcus rivularis NIES-593]
MYNIISRKTIPWLLLGSDIVGLIVCFNVAFLLRIDRLMSWDSLLSYGIISLCLLGLYIADTYRLDRYAIHIAGRLTPARILLSLAVTFGIASSFIYVTGLWGSQPITGRGILLLGIVFFAIWAVISRFAVVRWLQQKIEQSRWLVIGTREEAAQLECEYRAFSPKTEFVFWSDRSEKPVAKGNLALSVRSTDKLAILCQQQWSGVLIAQDKEPLSDATVRQLMAMRLRGIYVYELSAFYEQFWGRIPPVLIKEDWFAFAAGFSLLHSRINVKLKRLLDVVIAGVLLIVMLPAMLLVALAIAIDSPGPIFYSQVRTGLNRQKFKVHKFRSMYRDAEKMGVQWASTKDSRITRVGGWLRVMRIDELPQLWNVLKGEMSLIGPRPERPEFDRQLRQEIPYYDLRYLVKPGITGWAQVNYPYGASVEDAYQKVAYDLYYLKNYSLLLDVMIILKTLRVVFLGKGR